MSDSAHLFWNESDDEIFEDDDYVATDGQPKPSSAAILAPPPPLTSTGTIAGQPAATAQPSLVQLRRPKVLGRQVFANALVANNSSAQTADQKCSTLPTAGQTLSAQTVGQIYQRLSGSAVNESVTSSTSSTATKPVKTSDVDSHIGAERVDQKNKCCPVVVASNGGEQKTKGAGLSDREVAAELEGLPAFRKFDDYLRKAIDGLDGSQRLTAEQWFSRLESRFQSLVIDDIKGGHEFNQIKTDCSQLLSALQRLDPTVARLSPAGPQCPDLLTGDSNIPGAVRESSAQTLISGNIIVENIFV